jgi:hypothetical protein
MPWPVELQYVQKAEQDLGVKFPLDFVVELRRMNGGTIVFDGDDAWELHPVWDTSDDKRASRTCNDIVRETRTARAWYGFPQDAVAIADGGDGDLLVLVPGESAVQLSDTVYFWRHETGELEVAAESVAELFEHREI